MNSTISYVFSTEDPFGNTVTLAQDRWQKHIDSGHRDMVPYQRAVQTTVENPTYIYESTENEYALVFHAHGLLPRVITSLG